MDDGPKASTSYSSYEEVTQLSVRQRTYPAGLPYAVDDEVVVHRVWPRLALKCRVASCAIRLVHHLA